MSRTGKNMLDAVKRHLSKSGWDFERISEEPAVKAVYRGCKTWDIIVYADDEKSALSFICPQLAEAVEEDPGVFRMINAINANILVGKLIYLEDQKTISAVITVLCDPEKIEDETVLRPLSTLCMILEYTAPYLEEHHSVHEGDRAAEPAAQHVPGDDLN
ncbi:MAG: YbjN domain-containing protein [Pseudomonadota bacterium]